LGRIAAALTRPTKHRVRNVTSKSMIGTAEGGGVRERTREEAECVFNASCLLSTWTNYPPCRNLRRWIMKWCKVYVQPSRTVPITVWCLHRDGAFVYAPPHTRTLNACRRASELLMSIPKQKRNALRSQQTSPVENSSFHGLHASTPARPSRASRPSLSFAVSSTPFLPKSGDFPGNMTLDMDKDLEIEEEGPLMAATALFHAREYHRVQTQLADCQSTKARFLHLYSRYLVCFMEVCVRLEDDLRTKTEGR
jgi:hypothetical protein